MMIEVLTPIITIAGITIMSILSIDRLCQFHSAYLQAAATIEGERWLRVQCQDPEFFSNLKTHTDLCFTVQNNARVGSFMLALNQVTGAGRLEMAASDIASTIRAIGWPFLAVAAAMFLICPSLIVSSWRSRPYKRIPYTNPNYGHEA